MHKTKASRERERPEGSRSPGHSRSRLAWEDGNQPQEPVRLLVLINAVGLTPRLLPLAPRLAALAQAAGCGRWREVRARRHLHGPGHAADRPARRTGTASSANGWLFRDTDGGPLLAAVQPPDPGGAAVPDRPPARRRRGRTFRCAKLFWWFNQGAAVDCQRHAQAVLRAPTATRRSASTARRTA